MKKQLVVLSAAAMVAAAAVPALAFENEFHGMYKFMGFQSNFFNGATAGLMDSYDGGFFAEQRARLMYTAKANDNLKLVTHFELDTRFGGKDTTKGYLGTASGNDAGNLDADQLTLETKSIYLDFNCPVTNANMKVGLQPWKDEYQSLFLLADMTGVNVTKKFDAFTGSLGWFRFDDNTVDNQTTSTYSNGPGEFTADLFVLDGKFAINKDMKVGASYYYIDNDTDLVTTGVSNVGFAGGAAARADANSFTNLHVIGLNADLTFGPANVKPFFAYQTGDIDDKRNTDGYLLGTTAKIKAGPGAVNLAGFYLSGDDQTDAKAATEDQENFRIISPFTSYFNAANMWLLLRNGQQVNSSTSILGNDITANGRGTWGLFGGYEGTAGKVFYNANIGYMATVEDRNDEKNEIGTEINAQVGYKLFDNLSASVAAAYVFLGDGMNSDDSTELIAGKGMQDAIDPYMFNVQLSYTF